MANNQFRDPFDRVQTALVNTSAKVGLQEWGEVDLWGYKNADRILAMACTDAAASDLEIALPAGRGSAGAPAVLKTTEPINLRTLYPRISGGARASIIQPDDNDYNWMILGTGAAPDLTGGIAPTLGWARDFQLIGKNPTKSPAGLSVGLTINGVIGFAGRGIYIRGCPIAIDPINNCYISSLMDCGSDFDGCRIFIRLSGQRPGMPFASGNDWVFINCRMHGREAGMWVDEFGGGYACYGGQIHAGTGAAAPNDLLGNIVIGKNFETGVITGSNQGVRLYGTSLENTQNGWGVRAFGVQAFPNGITLKLDGVAFVGSTGAIGGVKISDGFDDVVEIKNCSASGAWSAANFIDVDTTPLGNARPIYEESGWRAHVGGFVTLNGQPRRFNDLSPMMLANIPNAYARTSYYEYKDRQLFQYHFSLYRRSINWHAQVINANFDGVGTWNPDAPGVTWIEMP